MWVITYSFYMSRDSAAFIQKQDVTQHGEFRTGCVQNGVKLWHSLSNRHFHLKLYFVPTNVEINLCELIKSVTSLCTNLMSDHNVTWYIKIVSFIKVFLINTSFSILSLYLYTHFLPQGEKKTRFHFESCFNFFSSRSLEKKHDHFSKPTSTPNMIITKFLTG
jgi:hypothetical protein